MASYNGEPCAVSVVDPGSLRVVIGDVSFVMNLSECEISGGWFGDIVEIISADGILMLSSAEYSALQIPDKSLELAKTVGLWVGAAALVVGTLILGVRFSAGPLSRMISLQTEARWFPFTYADDEDLKVLLRELPETSGLHIALDDEADEVNAFALPGGTIRVTKALVCFAKSPGELIGVIGHEVGHIKRRHVMRSLITSLGTQFLLVAVLGGGVPTSLSESMISREFSIADEREADEYAANALIASGLSPVSLGYFFERLAKEKPILLEAVLSDHPQTAARIAYFRSENTKPLKIDARAAEARNTAWTELRKSHCPD